jgi:hypothetical protein
MICPACRCQLGSGELVQVAFTKAGTKRHTREAWCCYCNKPVIKHYYIKEVPRATS